MGDLRKSFHDDIAEAKNELIRLAGTVTESIPRATKILLEGDLVDAEALIMGDDEIDVRSLQIEQHCYQILALQAPVASDLRQVVALLKMVADVKRANGLLCNVGKAARRLAGTPIDPSLQGIIESMSSEAQRLFEMAIESFVEDDEIKAAAIDEMDGLLDDLQGRFIQAIFESHSEGRIGLQMAIQLALVARFYERIGDHAVNIGERVGFVVTGGLPEHVAAERYRKRAEFSKRQDPST